MYELCIRDGRAARGVAARWQGYQASKRGTEDLKKTLANKKRKASGGIESSDEDDAPAQKFPKLAAPSAALAAPTAADNQAAQDRAAVDAACAGAAALRRALVVGAQAGADARRELVKVEAALQVLKRDV